MRSSLPDEPNKEENYRQKESVFETQNNLLCLKLEAQGQRVMTDKQTRDKLWRAFEYHAKEFRLCMRGSIKPIKNFEQTLYQVSALQSIGMGQGAGNRKNEALAIIQERKYIKRGEKQLLAVMPE